MARYRYLCPLRWGDMDAYGHVNNVLFLRYLEEARIGMFNAAAPDDGGGLVDTGILVSRHEIDYLVPLHYRPAPVADRRLGQAGSGVPRSTSATRCSTRVPTVHRTPSTPGRVHDGRLRLPAGAAAPARGVEKARLHGWEDEPVPLKRRTSARAGAPEAQAVGTRLGSAWRIRGILAIASAPIPQPLLGRDRRWTSMSNASSHSNTISITARDRGREDRHHLGRAGHRPVLGDQPDAAG